MCEKEKEIEKPNERVDIAEKILDFNDQTQREQELKILTSNQILSRLPITLAHLKARNNETTIAFLVTFKKLNQNNL